MLVKITGTATIIRVIFVPNNKPIHLEFSNEGKPRPRPWLRTREESSEYLILSGFSSFEPLSFLNVSLSFICSSKRERISLVTVGVESCAKFDFTS